MRHMFYLALIGASVIATPLHAQEQPAGETPSPQEKEVDIGACEISADCMIKPSHCGQYVAINAKTEKFYEMLMGMMAGRVNCQNAPAAAAPTEAECVNKECRIKGQPED